jgi:cob(I)alamin adenosyltransferase
MPKLTKIYTRQGDQGTTKLSSGETVSKNNPRVVAYGTVDELNAQIGLAMTNRLEEITLAQLQAVQNELFHLGSDLSFTMTAGEVRAIPQIEKRHIEKLESNIDELNAQIAPLENFVLPGGTRGAAQLHVARTVCRRAEREVIALTTQEPVSPLAAIYLNRLSDLLFVMARYENHSKDIPEPIWDSRA